MATANRKATARKATTRKTPAKRGKAAVRRPPADSAPPSINPAHVQGFVAGILAGVLLGGAGGVWLSKNGTVRTEPSSEPLTRQEDPQPRFDFYTVLPSQTLDLASDVAPPDLSANAKTDLYVLQAGSFRLQEDADRRRGELALLGLEGTIERTTSDNGAWYRVYLGPFESRSKMAQARSITAQQSIDTLLLRRPRTP